MTNVYFFPREGFVYSILSHTDCTEAQEKKKSITAYTIVS